MKYLLDRCVLSDFVKGNINIINRIIKSQPAAIAISSLTIMEIEYGILRTPGQKAENIKRIIYQLIESIGIIPLE